MLAIDTAFLWHPGPGLASTMAPLATCVVKSGCGHTTELVYAFQHAWRGLVAGAALAGALFSMAVTTRGSTLHPRLIASGTSVAITTFAIFALYYLSL